jgi:hypothetical protein
VSVTFLTAAPPFAPWRRGGPPSARAYDFGALLAAQLDLAVELAFRLAVGDRAALVAELLAPPDRDLGLHPAVLEVEPRRDEGEALLPHLCVEALDLAPVHQELPRPVRLVVGPVAGSVLGDVQADEPRLAVAHLGVRLLERRLALTERLHLGPGQHEAGLDPIEEVEVVPRAAVLDDQLFSLRLGHRAEV